MGRAEQKKREGHLADKKGKRDKKKIRTRGEKDLRKKCVNGNCMNEEYAIGR